MVAQSSLKVSPRWPRTSQAYSCRRRDYDALFGRGRPLPFGQVYATLAACPGTARALALILGRPAEQYLDAQRAAHLQRIRALTERRRRGGVVDALLADYGLFHLEADRRWIDISAASRPTLRIPMS